MSKASKQKYNSKVTFDGTFEELLGMTFRTPKCKFEIGDVVERDGDTKQYIVIASKNSGKVPYGSDYSIQLKDESAMLFVKENEIHYVK